MAKDKGDKQAPSHTEKTLSVRIPEAKHRALKSACVAEGVSIRSVLLAAISELETDSPTAKNLLRAAAASDNASSK